MHNLNARHSSLSRFRLQPASQPASRIATDQGNTVADFGVLLSSFAFYTGFLLVPKSMMPSAINDATAYAVSAAAHLAATSQSY